MASSVKKPLVAQHGFIVRDDVDPTKQVEFDVSGVSTGTTRQFKVPNKDINIADNPTTTIGDISYASTTATPAELSRLAGNTTTTKKYLSQTGDGVNSAAPSWSQPAISELVAIAALSVVGNATNGVAAPSAIEAATDHYVLRRSGTSLGFGLLTNNNIGAAAAIAGTKVSPAFGDQNITVGDGYGLDTNAAGVLAVGGTNATSITLGKSGTTTANLHTIHGGLTINGSESTISGNFDGLLSVLSIQNLNTGTSATARLYMNTEGGGDVYTLLDADGVNYWSYGIDRSASNAFVIVPAVSLEAGTAAISITPTGDTTIECTAGVSLRIKKASANALMAIYGSNGVKSYLQSTDGTLQYLANNATTVLGSVDQNSLFIFGTAGSTARQHKFNGNIYMEASNSGASIAGNNFSMVTARAYLDTDGSLKSTGAGGGASIVQLIGRSTGTDTAFIIYTDKTVFTGSGQATSLTNIMQGTADGAWAIGPSTGGSLTHGFRSGAKTSLQIRSVSTNEVVLDFYRDGAEKYAIYMPAGATEALNFYKYGLGTMGSFSAAGLLTLDYGLTVTGAISSTVASGSNLTLKKGTGPSISWWADTAGSSNTYSIDNNSGTYRLYNHGASFLHQITQAGIHYIGIGGNNSAQHVVYGNVKALAYYPSATNGGAAYSSEHFSLFGSNIYINSAGGARAMVSRDGASYIQIISRTNSTEKALVFAAKYGAVTVDTAPGEAELFSITAGGAAVIGPSGTTTANFHTFNGGISVNGSSTITGYIAKSRLTRSSWSGGGTDPWVVCTLAADEAYLINVWTTSGTQNAIVYAYRNSSAIYYIVLSANSISFDVSGSDLRAKNDGAITSGRCGVLQIG